MPKKILIVEDDTDMVELLCFNLKTVGYALGTAVDGIEAFKKGFFWNCLVIFHWLV